MSSADLCVVYGWSALLKGKSDDLEEVKNHLVDFSIRPISYDGHHDVELEIEAGVGEKLWGGDLEFYIGFRLISDCPLVTGEIAVGTLDPSSIAESDMETLKEKLIGYLREAGIEEDSKTFKVTIRKGIIIDRFD